MTRFSVCTSSARMRTELIAEACVAMQLESTAEELGRTMHAHPTVSEAVMEAAEGVHGLAVHI